MGICQQINLELNLILAIPANDLSVDSTKEQIACLKRVIARSGIPHCVRNRLRNLVNSLDSRKIAALPRLFYERAGSFAMTKSQFLYKLRSSCLERVIVPKVRDPEQKRRTK